MDIILQFSTVLRFEEQIAKVSISPLQCEPYTDVSLSTRLGEVNGTVIEIQSALSSFEEHINDTFSTLKEDIRENATDIWMDITNIRHDVSSLRQDVETNLTSLDDDILAINNTLLDSAKMILLTTGAYVLQLLK